MHFLYSHAHEYGSISVSTNSLQKSPKIEYILWLTHEKKKRKINSRRARQIKNSAGLDTVQTGLDLTPYFNMWLKWFKKEKMRITRVLNWAAYPRVHTLGCNESFLWFYLLSLHSTRVQKDILRIQIIWTKFIDSNVPISRSFHLTTWNFRQSCKKTSSISYRYIFIK